MGPRRIVVKAVCSSVLKLSVVVVCIFLMIFCPVCVSKYHPEIGLSGARV